MLSYAHTLHPEREVPERGKFVENLNAPVKQVHTLSLSFPPSFSLSKRWCIRKCHTLIAPFLFSLSLSLSPRWTPDQAISTTGVLNATTLIYARRAGITAAAGTRLALFLHSA